MLLIATQQATIKMAVDTEMAAPLYGRHAIQSAQQFCGKGKMAPQSSQ